MKIDRIYVDTCPRDIRQTYINLTSIRHWYPDIPITILMDPDHKDFIAPELARLWGCDICMPSSQFGHNVAKLYVLLLPAGSRVLYLDSDIVFLGPVLDRLEKYDEDLIVVDEFHSLANVNKDYYNIDKLLAMDPDFTFTQRCFNAGQFVVTTGLIKESDFQSVVDISEEALVQKYDFFGGQDQGVMNYVVQKMEQQGRLSMRRDPFMLWGGGDLSEIDVEKLDNCSPYNQLVHWAGFSIATGSVPNKHILKYFEDLFVEYLAEGLTRMEQ